MDYSFGVAIGAGLVGAAAMAVLLYMTIAMMPSQMKMNLFYMLGSMVTRSKGAVYLAGAMAWDCLCHRPHQAVSRIRTGVYPHWMGYYLRYRPLGCGWNGHGSD